jgi:transitional endoplasmic reticulum ATPase
VNLLNSQQARTIRAQRSTLSIARARSRGQASFEQVVLLALVAVVGAASFGLLGRSAHDAIAGDAKGTGTDSFAAVATNAPPAVGPTAQAGTVEALARMARKVGGMEKEVEAVWEVASMRLNDDYRIARAGVKSPPRGVILHGPPGTGKTLIGKTIAEESGARFFFLNGAELQTPNVGQSEAMLRQIFDEARESGKAVIMFDEIDALASKRGDVPHYAKTLMTQFLTLMSEIGDNEKIVVLGTTNRLDDLDPAVRRPGRFDKEIEIGPPGEAGIRKILDIHTDAMKFASDVSLDDVAKRLKGYVGADIQAVATEAGLEVVRRLDKAGDHDRVINDLIDGWKAQYAERLPRKLVFRSTTSGKRNRVVMSVADYPGQPLGQRSAAALQNHYLSVQGLLTPPWLREQIDSVTQSGELLPEGTVLGTVDLGAADHAVFLANAKEAGILGDLLNEALPAEIQRALGEIKEPVTKADFDTAIQKIKPSATREHYVDVSGTKWDDIGGYDDVKEAIYDRVVLPLSHPERLERLGYKATPEHIILTGPPGTGKTMFAKAIANEVGANVITVKLSDMTSKYINEGPEKIAEIFKRCRASKPCVLIIDEIDAVTKSREGANAHAEDQKVVNALLAELDGLDNNDGVIVIGTTNKADAIDGGLMRPGRFGAPITVGLPDQAAREKIFAIHLRGKKAERGMKVEDLARRSEGLSGADIEQAVQDAGIAAAKQDRRYVPKEAFEKAIEKLRAQREAKAAENGGDAVAKKQPIGFRRPSDDAR